MFVVGPKVDGSGEQSGGDRFFNISGSDRTGLSGSDRAGLSGSDRAGLDIHFDGLGDFFVILRGRLVVPVSGRVGGVIVRSFPSTGEAKEVHSEHGAFGLTPVRLEPRHETCIDRQVVTELSTSIDWIRGGREEASSLSAHGDSAHLISGSVRTQGHLQHLGVQLSASCGRRGFLGLYLHTELGEVPIGVAGGAARGRSGTLVREVSLHSTAEAGPLDLVLLAISGHLPRRLSDCQLHYSGLLRLLFAGLRGVRLLVLLPLASLRTAATGTVAAGGVAGSGGVRAGTLLVVNNLVILRVVPEHRHLAADVSVGGVVGVSLSVGIHLRDNTGPERLVHTLRHLVDLVRVRDDIASLVELPVKLPDALDVHVHVLRRVLVADLEEVLPEGFHHISSETLADLLQQLK